MQGDKWTACPDGTCVVLGSVGQSVEKKAEVKPVRKNKIIDSQIGTSEDKTRSLQPEIKQEVDLNNIKPGTKFIYTDPDTNTKMQYEFLQPAATVLAFRVEPLGTFFRNENGTFRLEKTRNLEIEVKKLTIDLKSREEVINYINERPNEAFMVSIGVPLKCPPCKLLEERLPQIVKSVNAAGSEVTIIKAEFDDFKSAQKEWGESMRFPHSFLLSKNPEVIVLKSPMYPNISDSGTDALTREPVGPGS